MSRKRANVVSVFGLFAGLTMMLLGLFDRPTLDLSSRLGDAAVMLGGRSISKDEFYRRLKLLFDRRSNVSEEDRLRLQREVIDEIVTEELLLDRAIELGLARTEPLARRHLLGAMVEIATRTSSELVPNDADLMALYERRVSPSNLRYVVRQVSFSGDDGDRTLRCEALRHDWTDGDAESANRLGGHEVERAPKGPLSIETMRDYFGPTATRAIVTLRPGEVTPCLDAKTGTRLFRLERTEEGPRATFEASRRALVELARNEHASVLLSAYVDELRRGREIWSDPALIDAPVTIPRHILAESSARRLGGAD